MTSRDASKGQNNPKGITDPPEHQLRLGSHEVKLVSHALLAEKVQLQVKS